MCFLRFVLLPCRAMGGLWAMLLKYPYGHIKIHDECQVGIEKSVLRVTDWHHEACQVITRDVCAAVCFLSFPHSGTGM